MADAIQALWLATICSRCCTFLLAASPCDKTSARDMPPATAVDAVAADDCDHVPSSSVMGSVMGRVAAAAARSNNSPVDAPDVWLIGGEGGGAPAPNFLPMRVV